ncbi:MAG: ABC transporter ATP-binding protein [Clostridia bacterium]|jgi:oligopeptide transport system ATP-binding protein|nr:ABC transporter ATP-binding protein [Clostridia bacterium]
MLISGENLRKEFILEKQPFTGKPLKVYVALEDVNINIESGKTMGLVGESGSGKSTTGEILGNLQLPTSGTVFYEGKDITKLTKAEYKEYRRNVQYIFQDPKGSMSPFLTIKEIIAEPLQIMGLVKDQKTIDHLVEEVLTKVSLPSSFSTRYAGELSGGQCQRVAIARAIIVKPKLIICDEPVSALDVTIQGQIMELLKDLQKEYNMAYLFISHDLGVVNYMSDEIMVMQSGKIIEVGEAEQIIQHPKHDYTISLLSSASLTA